MSNARWLRWAGVALVVALAGFFSWLNSGESVALDFGLFVVYQVRLVTLLYLAFLLGMTTMFLVGLRQDYRLRRLLQERGLLEPPEARSSEPALPPPLPPEPPV
jgi:hypothetical protein